MAADAGITFTEVMIGGFALGETEPARGDRLGTEAGTPLVLRASLSIPSVKTFVADAEHTGALEGRVSFAPIGSDLQAVGFFKLFMRTNDPSLKLMQYRLTFRRGTDVYCLHGAKHVRKGSPLRGWKDTTTLLCRLHAGGDAAGAVIGAGILRLRPMSFAKQLCSFRMLNGSSAAAKASALTGFVGFFAGELLDSYL